jgi:nucleotide-binding universal stress UspA family protein
MSTIRKILVPTDFSPHAQEAFRVADRPDASHILRILQERGCDLILIGTHRVSRLRRLLSGSVTEDVVRNAECPVMVVKAPVSEAVAPSRTMVGQTTSRATA